MEVKDCESDSQSRMVPLDIDLNETPPLSSPDDVAEGKGKLVLFDINALPSEAEAERQESQTPQFVSFSLGMHNVRDSSSIGNSNSAPVTCSNLLFVGNQYDFMKAPGNMTSIVKPDPVDIVQQRHNFLRNMKEVDIQSVYTRKHWASDYSANEVSVQNQSEKLLQNLREFIFDNHGVLEDGWRVEFFYCQKRCKTFAVYCSPDGNKFESVFDVACHLGLVSNCDSLLPQFRNDGFDLAWNMLHLQRLRKESLMFSRAKNLKECQEIAGKFSFGIENMSAETCRLRNNIRVAQASSEPAGANGSSHCKDGFPVQFEDFSILSVGEIDPRPSYHSSSQIWPVGYKSSWHDKITGSLFICDISDGGDCGPVFKVQRYPCSTQHIPTGSTVLSRTSFGTDNNKTEDAFDIDDNDEINVQMIFSDHSPPHLDFGSFTGVTTALHEVSIFQPVDGLQTNSTCISQNLWKPAFHNGRLGDDIGEFLVEGRSSSSVWRMVSVKLLHSFREVYKQTGVFKFCCRHAYEWWSSCRVREIGEAIESTDPLAKFCHMSGPFYIPHNVESIDELTTSCEALEKWLDQDRFGLDIDFVREIVEQLPGVHSCSEYTFLNKRSDKSNLQTVGNWFLQAKRKDDVQSERKLFNMLKGCKNHRKQLLKDLCPPGKLLSSKLPTVLVGDVLQSWELLWRFSEVLGLEEPLSFKELEEELVDCYSFTLKSSSMSPVNGKCETPLMTEEMETLGECPEVRQTPNARISHAGETLSRAYCWLLKALLAELQSKLAVFVDPTLESGESRSRKRRKKEADNLMFSGKPMLDFLPVNRLTWPELARRYLLTISSMEGNLDSQEVVSRESCKVFHCLQGDSRALHGSLPGVAVMEAEALLLAEATKKIFGTSKNINDNLNMDSNNSIAAISIKEVEVSDGEVPKWAKVLEPVRKLPTNVGARIRRCIYDALALKPPEWATKILEHSISKEVYKGNASGPTKKAVLSVLADVCGENVQQKPNRKKKPKHVSTLSEVIMKQCRKVLRCAVAADEEKVFCNLLGRTLLNTSDNDDEGLLGFPAMVSRPLDFRTIDLRLAFGAYGGSHEAFLEDVREVWHHICTAFADQSDLVHLAETLSQNFEALYEKEVLVLVQKFTGYAALDCLSSEAKKEMEYIFENAVEIPKAPWDEGVCKVCGVDKDDVNVLLCDKCDSGYHTYCLNPPLARIPEGNWYCPSCITGYCITNGASLAPQFISQCPKKRHQGKFTHGVLEALANLGTTMEMKDYWEYSMEERIFLLKFLGDEVLNSSNIREHLDQCASVSTDLQQKLHSLSSEWRDLRFREVLSETVVKANKSVLNGVEKSGMEGMPTVLSKYDKLFGQPLARPGLCSTPSVDIPLEDAAHSNGTNDFIKQPSCFYPKDVLEQHSTSSDCQYIKFPSKHQINQLNMNELEASNLEAKFIKNRISGLQDSITCLDLQLQKASLRKDFLGRDSGGCLYWVFSRPGSYPWVVVDGTTVVQQKSIVEEHRELLSNNLALKSSPIGAEDLLNCKGSIAFSLSDSTNGVPVSFQWFSYQSDSEIEELVQWLRNNDPIQRELIESLLQLQKFGCNNSNNTRNCLEMHHKFPTPINAEKIVKSNATDTKASIALEKKYGCCLELNNNVIVKWSQDEEATHEERICRCECLEPVWPSRHHCHSCHWSFSSRCELKQHNDGKCSSAGTRAHQNSKVSGDVSKGKAMMRIEKGECSNKTRHCKSANLGREIEFGLVGFPKESSPYNLEEISVKFLTRSSNKELVKEIGLLGSNGIPSFVPCASPYLSDPTLKLLPPWKNEVGQSSRSTSIENQSLQAVQGDMLTSKRHVNPSFNSIKCFTSGDVHKALQEFGRFNLMNDRRDQSSLMFSCSKQRNALFEIHDSSLRPLVGKGAEILRHLKINLLDMDAALPEEALKSSKALLEKRCTWRAFVKSAKSVYEMVQATIVFENMIKTDYLRNEWWYWSSLSAAVKIATVSSLALRIYTLDAAIIYEKLSHLCPKEIAQVGSKSENNSSPHPDLASNPKLSSKPVGRTSSLDPTDNSKPRSRSGRKRKDSGG